MIGHLTPGRTIELVAAIAILIASVWLYRKNRSVDRGYGSQGAVLLLVIGVIMAIHALGLLEYHPTKAEAEYFRAHSR
jgi:hypothetical protein